MTDKNTQNEVSIEFVPNGPTLVKGIFLLKENGQLIKKNGPVALCRCGQSNKKPYCDNSHTAADFKAE